MQMQSHRIRVFTDRYPLLGPLFWGLSLQYYAVQIIAARAWTLPYSLKYNTISDLANTACGTYGARYVCSPEHAIMNASFIVLGLTMFFGAGLIYHEFHPSRGAFVGFLALALAGLGTAMVGVFPENRDIVLHVIGAALPFFIGNLGVLILGLSLNLQPVFKWYTILSGVVPLIALGLFLTGTYLGLGMGGMERIVAYPQTTWLILFSLYMSMSRYRARAAKRTQTN